MITHDNYGKNLQKLHSTCYCVDVLSLEQKQEESTEKKGRDKGGQRQGYTCFNQTMYQFLFFDVSFLKSRDEMEIKIKERIQLAG